MSFSKTPRGSRTARAAKSSVPASSLKAALKSYRKLMATDRRWLQGLFAAKKDGEHCNEHDRDAWAFCMVGGIHRVNCLGLVKTELFNVLLKSAKTLFPATTKSDGFWGLMDFNDMPGRTHQDILNVIDHAIADVSARPA